MDYNWWDDNHMEIWSDKITDLNKMLGEKWDGNYTRILHAILNKSSIQHSTKQQLHGHLTSISQSKMHKTCWKKKDELISDILLYRFLHMDTPVLNEQQKHIHQLCANTCCHLKDSLSTVSESRKDNLGKVQESMKPVTTVGYFLLMSV